MTKMYDVIAVKIADHEVRMIAENKSERNAGVIEAMTEMRRGMDKEFFAIVPHGRYKEGDEWDGP